MLLEGSKKGAIDNTVDQFYYLARTTLVKDEAHYRQVRPRLRRLLQRAWSCSPTSARTCRSNGCASTSSSSSARRAAAIEKMGWDELMETPMEKRLEEQKERHEGGSKWIGTGGTSPSAPTATTRRASASARQGRNRSAVVWDQRAFRDSTTTRTRHAQHQGRAAPAAPLRARGAQGADLDDTIRSTAANAGWLDIKMVPERLATR